MATYIKEKVITKLQKLYSPPRKLRAGNKLPALFLKKSLCTGDLSSACKIFIERPGWVQVPQNGVRKCFLTHDPETCCTYI